MWTSHTYKSCTQAPTILVLGDWDTECKPNRKSNPRGCIVTNHQQVVINPDDSILSGYVKTDRVLYKKNECVFSINKGANLLFDETGCHILEERYKYE